MSTSAKAAADLGDRELDLWERFGAPPAGVTRIIDAMRRRDPVRLAASVGLELDDWQKEVCLTPRRRQILNCARQVGKSTTVGVKTANVAQRPDSLILLLSPTLQQSSELYRKAMSVTKSAECGLEILRESALRVEFTNGSRIISLPGKDGSVRGFSGVDLLIVDEASRVPDDLYRAIRPMLATSGGELILLSTPWGKRGFFYEEWNNSEGDDSWLRVRVPATECPRIPANFLLEEQRSLGDFWYAQEYLCEFLDVSEQAFRREDVEEAFSEEGEAWW